MCLLVKGDAKSIDSDFVSYTLEDWVEKSKELIHHKKIRTVSFEIAVPDIIVLTHYDRLPMREVKFTRQNVFQRDKYICQYCGLKFKMHELTKDHIIPRSRNGKNSWNNIVTCCFSCNHKKSDRTPAEARMKLIHLPTTPNWFNPLTKLVNHPRLKPAWKDFLEKTGF